jgi:hypothetical protein
MVRECDNGVEEVRVRREFGFFPAYTFLLPFYPFFYFFGFGCLCCVVEDEGIAFGDGSRPFGLFCFFLYWVEFFIFLFIFCFLPFFVGFFFPN